MRVALLSHNARAGDAIGHQVAARAAFFRDRAAEVRILVESDAHLNADLRPYARVISADTDLDALASELRSCDLIVADYGRHTRLLDVLPLVAGRGPRILFDYHGVTPPELWDGPAEVLRDGQRQRSLVWYADLAVVHSDFMRRELYDATGYPIERVHVLPLWSAARIVDSAEGRLRAKLGLLSERLLLFVGRLAPNKRVPVLIEALALLKDERPTVHAVIIGDAGDVYRRQLQLCRELAEQRSVSKRVHFLGHVSDDELADAYRSADVFVMPSLHEGCCVPVREAMAAGLPVVAARAAALPETVAGTGLTFAPDDAEDLARQLRCVLDSTPPPGPLPEAERGRSFSPPLRFGEGAGGRGSSRRIAVISPRYGDGVLGGAERSLRMIAESLASAGHSVEVFTTGRGDETIDGVRVHRFPADPVDEAALAAATQALRPGGPISETLLNDYFRQTRGSIALLEEYVRRQDDFDTFIVGPYSNGLTWEAVRIRPERTLLVPCFHREPLANQPALQTTLSRVGGLLFHSDAERRLAERELGIDHPNSAVIGTWLPFGSGDAARGRQLVGPDRPYLLYSGRCCREKNLPLLVEWLKRYEFEFAQRFRFAFTGGETASLPVGRNWKDLGFLSEADKADIFAGAAAVVQLSVNESLSLVALEAWREGVPVVAHSGCDVLAELIRRSGGGAAVNGCEQFRDALNDLWQQVPHWAEAGRRGREFVQEQYGSRETFATRVAEVLQNLDRPLADLMRERGHQAAAVWTDGAWQRAFAERVDAVLHAEPIEPMVAASVTPRKGEAIRVRPASRRVGVRLTNTGTAPLWPDGLHAIWVRCTIADNVTVTRLPQLVNPGQSILLGVRLPEFDAAGKCRVEFALQRGDVSIPAGGIPLSASGAPSPSGGAIDDSLLAELSARLVEAEALAELPASYEDVSDGVLAKWKRAVKRKLLHQFRISYVDVLSRQQTAMNRVLLSAVQELAECASLLGQPAEEPAAAPAEELARTISRLKEQVRRTARRMDALERRLDALEESARVRDTSEMR